jgi:hypothetical protein
MKYLIWLQTEAISSFGGWIYEGPEIPIAMRPRQWIPLPTVLCFKSPADRARFRGTLGPPTMASEGRYAAWRSYLVVLFCLHNGSSMRAQPPTQFSYLPRAHSGSE